MPGAMLNPAGLKKPHALISRSLQIGEEDWILGRWKLLLLVDGQGRGEEDGGREGICVWGREALPRGCGGGGGIPESLSGILYPSSPFRPGSQFKSNNFGPQLLPACHVPTQSFFEIWSCS